MFCFSSFKKNNSGQTGHHASPACLFGQLPFLLSPPRLFVRPFSRFPSFLVFFWGAILGPVFFGFSRDLLRFFSWTRGGKGVLVDSPFVVFVLPLLWLSAAAHVFRRPSSSTPKWAKTPAFWRMVYGKRGKCCYFLPAAVSRKFPLLLKNPAFFNFVSGALPDELCGCVRKPHFNF